MHAATIDSHAQVGFGSKTQVAAVNSDTLVRLLGDAPYLEDVDCLEPKTLHQRRHAECCDKVCDSHTLHVPHILNLCHSCGPVAEVLQRCSEWPPSSILQGMYATVVRDKQQLSTRVPDGTDKSMIKALCRRRLTFNSRHTFMMKGGTLL